MKGYRTYINLGIAAVAGGLLTGYHVFNGDLSLEMVLRDTWSVFLPIGLAYLRASQPDKQ